MDLLVGGGWWCREKSARPLNFGKGRVQEECQSNFFNLERNIMSPLPQGQCFANSTDHCCVKLQMIMNLVNGRIPNHDYGSMINTPPPPPPPPPPHTHRSGWVHP
jgi:hypothetical protein